MEDPNIIEGEAADDDPDVLAGMAQLKQLRDAENDVTDLPHLPPRA